MSGAGRDPRPFRFAPGPRAPLEQLEFPELQHRPTRPRRREGPVEFKVVALRDCPVPKGLEECDTPEKAAAYWRLHVATTKTFVPDVESFVVLHLNTRRRIRGHHVVATGVLDSVQVHAREVFRTAIVANSSAVILMHNHPSGDASPSDADILITRNLIRAGQLLKIDVVDHVIVGAGRPVSLKTMGYFYE
ncbi:MAG TPA: JAB domain-containing protein [Verrucomicrobiota bacterium]|nr:hypothetical protein [Verrucomicrobiales bacterium]HRI12461.1 JAB domain-containing protein [Verrucomicrobiota bacterium]